MHASPLPCSAGALHRELNSRAATYALQHQYLHELCPGRAPSVLFGVDGAGRHGNFHPSSYRAILANPAWRLRLLKAHTAGLRARPRADWHWRELDCAASSDALLMSIFCHPGAFRSGELGALLGIPGTPAAYGACAERQHASGLEVQPVEAQGHAAGPVFGVRPRLARERNLIDTTEIDMQLGCGQELTFFEAKLTEKHFQTARAALLDRYTGWASVLDRDRLPRTAGGAFQGYQLIRGVLAAHAAGGSFCVLCDGRRTDLVAQWHGVLSAVASAALRCRLKLLTWQELSAALPAALQRFLAEKYGIVALPERAARLTKAGF